MLINEKRKSEFRKRCKIVETLKPKNIFHFSSVIEIFTFVVDDATLDNADD